MPDFIRLKAENLRVHDEWQTARETERRRLTGMRKAERGRLITALHVLLRKDVQPKVLAIMHYDCETERLGGRRPESCWPEFFEPDRTQEYLLDYREKYFRQEGWIEG